ncbi:MAG: Gfo/Idh/MocA family oxidoreductase [Solirubrobacterales bacterium]|nr:Gfo/Idh/MocA family oxidoreductase [Solirubrobacterales bacterium]
MRIAFAGLGWAARGFHLPPLKKMADVTVVGGFDSSEEQRSTWTKETGLPAYTSLDETIEAERPDLLVIATPPHSHADLCVEAVERGLHVFCEKPFVMDLDEADRVIAAASAAGRVVTVNHEFREKPIFRAVKEQIGGDRAGRLVFCQIWQLMDLAPWDEPVAWRAAMPNRTLFEGGVHLVDLLLDVFGELPTGVFARHSSGLDEEREADAVHLVTLDFPGNRLAQITIDRLCPAGTRYVEVRADCERASLRASLGGRAMVQIGKKRAEKTGIRIDVGSGGLAWMEEGLKRTKLATNPRQAGMHATGALMRKIVDAIRAGTTPPSSAQDARDVLAIIEAAYASARTGARVEPAYERRPAAQQAG